MNLSPLMPTRFSGQLKITDPEPKDPVSPEFRKHYLDGVKEELKQYESAIKNWMPQDVTIEYSPYCSPSGGMDDLSILMPQAYGTRTANCTGDGRHWREVKTPQERPLFLSQDPEALRTELGRFKRWLPGAILNLFIRVKGMESARLESFVKEKQQMIAQMDSVIAGQARVVNDLTAKDLKLTGLYQ